MEFDKYWEQFARLNKKVYLIVGGVAGLSEVIGFFLILANIIYLIRYGDESF